MSQKGPYIAGARYPEPGGSQGSPAAGPRLVLIWTWLVAYLAILAAACLSTELDDLRSFAAAFGVPPVLLFVGLCILGLLRGRIAWAYAIFWAVGCGAVVYFSVSVIVG